MNSQQLKNIIEAALLAADHPLSVDQLAVLFMPAHPEQSTEDAAPTRDELRQALFVLQQECDAKLERQDRTVSEMAVGDILVIWGMERNAAQHFAFVAEDGGRLTMIHALSKFHKVVEHGLDRGWAKRVLALYCIPGTEPV